MPQLQKCFDVSLGEPCRLTLGVQRCPGRRWPTSRPVLFVGCLLLSACNDTATTEPSGGTPRILDDRNYDDGPSLPPEAAPPDAATPEPTPYIYNVTGELRWDWGWSTSDTRPVVLSAWNESSLDAQGQPLSGARPYLTVRIPGPLNFPLPFALPLPPDEPFRLQAWLDLTYDSTLNTGDVEGMSSRFVPASNAVLQLSFGLEFY